MLIFERCEWNYDYHFCVALNLHSHLHFYGLTYIAICKPASDSIQEAAVIFIGPIINIIMIIMIALMKTLKRCLQPNYQLANSNWTSRIGAYTTSSIVANCELVVVVVFAILKRYCPLIERNLIDRCNTQCNPVVGFKTDD